MEALVSIITVNFNQTELTCALLDSLARYPFRNMELIVVDNGSTDNPFNTIQTRCPGVICIRSETNLGFAGGNNLGIKRATGNYLFLINNDAEVTDGCIATLITFLQDHPRAGIVSPLICYASRPEGAPLRIQYAGMSAVHPLTGRNRTIGNMAIDTGQFFESMPTAYVHGAAMMLPRTVLDQTGGMDDSFFLYYEELDWCEKIRRAGFETWVEPRARVLHKESMTVGRVSPLKTFYMTRNRLWFMRRHFAGGRWGLFQVFFWLLTVPKNSLLYIFRGELDLLRAFWRGAFAGYRVNGIQEELIED